VLPVSPPVVPVELSPPVMPAGAGEGLRSGVTEGEGEGLGVTTGGEGLGLGVTTGDGEGEGVTGFGLGEGCTGAAPMSNTCRQRIKVSKSDCKV
jgi:hypothetical protein